MLLVKRKSNNKPGDIGNVEVDVCTKSRDQTAGLVSFYHRNPLRGSKKSHTRFLKRKVQLIVFTIAATTLFQVIKNTTYLLRENSHQEEVQRQAFRRSVEPELNGSRNPQIEQEISDIIKQYQSVVKSVVNLQSGTWARHKGWTRAEDKNENHQDEKLSTSSKSHSHNSDHSVPMLPPPLSSSARWSTRGRSLSRISNINANIQEAVEGVLWDDESDIPSYFDNVLRECRKNAMIPKENNTFNDACFGFLNRLIHEPRCTVRLDSRITCDRANGHSESDGKLLPTKSIDSILGSEHFTSDTINIVIIGGGPVGLFLANALTELQLRSSPWAINMSTKPSIRLVVFENRLKTAEYHKRPYIRDWLTDIRKKNMLGAIDHRLSMVLDVFSKAINLPINAIETLLLLSNRDRGVKFVYGNFREYEELLKKVPNLLVFDATGHRLDQLERGQHDWGEGHTLAKGTSDLNVNVASVNETVFEWESESPSIITELNTKYHINQSILDSLKRNGDAHKIAIRTSAKSGQLWYPLLENNRSYVVHFLKVLNLPMSGKMRQQMTSLSETIHNPNLYTYKPKSFPYNNYQSSGWYREDIKNRLRIDDPGFSVRCSFLNLTPEQAIAMKSLLHRYAKGGDIHRVAFDQIPIEEFTKNEIFRTNKIDELLLLIQGGFLSPENYKNARSPLLSVFEMKSYMYSDPVVPGGFLDGKAPLLRIGDTLLTGDPHLATGLQRHMKIIRSLQCRLWNVHDTECETPPEISILSPALLML